MPRTKTKPTNNGHTALAEDQITDGAAFGMSLQEPFLVEITVVGTSALLMHGWNIQSIDSKAEAKKGSREKKTDNLESYVHRDDKGFLAIPTVNLAAAIAEAARSMPDPRSPRKSARDLIKSVVQANRPFATLEPKTKNWDFEHRCRVVIQRAGITRTRPAMKEGWKATFLLQNNGPEYFSEEAIHLLAVQAGRVAGLCDGRAIGYGKFRVTNFRRIAFKD